VKRNYVRERKEEINKQRQKEEKRKVEKTVTLSGKNEFLQSVHGVADVLFSRQPEILGARESFTEVGSIYNVCCGNVDFVAGCVTTPHS
jgi:hypothetical protein